MNSKGMTWVTVFVVLSFAFLIDSSTSLIWLMWLASGVLAMGLNEPFVSAEGVSN